MATPPPDPRLRVPERALRGDVIEIKAMVPHPMETGRRRDNRGKPIPRRIIHTFTCTYNGAEIFRVDMNPGIAANPYFAFHTIATESGSLTFTWFDDNGETITATAEITVS